MDIKEIEEKALKIRELYHRLEVKYHDKEWDVQEDALAFLSDAGIIGRLAMDFQGRWPSEERDLLPSKIGECVWWLITLANRMDLDFEKCVKEFVNSRLDLLQNNTSESK